MDWLNAFLLLLLVAGHTELLVTLVNRTHGLPIHIGPLRHFRHLDDLLIPLFPLLVLFRLGLGGPELMYGGSWSNVSTAWTVYLGICGCGTIGLFCSTVRWCLYKPPAQQVQCSSRVFRVDEALGHKPFGKGVYSFLAPVPFNEILQVEFSEKSFELDRVPTEWDGLSILHVSDVHLTGSLTRPFYERVFQECTTAKYDMIVFTGDLIDDPTLLDWLPSTLGQLDAPLGKYFIFGNHDWEFAPEDARQAMADIGWVDVSSRVLTIEHLGKELVLAGTERPWMGRQPDFSSIDKDTFRLLLSHTPDQIVWARSQNIDLMLAGHNHGGQAVLPIVGPVYAPSQFGVKYAAGTFYEAPTLLHVSRGLAGKHPLRWRCRPEITRVVLRSKR